MNTEGTLAHESPLGATLLAGLRRTLAYVAQGRREKAFRCDDARQQLCGSVWRRKLSSYCFNKVGRPGRSDERAFTTYARAAVRDARHGGHVAPLRFHGWHASYPMSSGCSCQPQWLCCFRDRTKYRQGTAGSATFAAAFSDENGQTELGRCSEIIPQTEPSLATNLQSTSGDARLQGYLTGSKLVSANSSINQAPPHYEAQVTADAGVIATAVITRATPIPNPVPSGAESDYLTYASALDQRATICFTALYADQHPRSGSLSEEYQGLRRDLPCLQTVYQLWLKKPAPRSSSWTPTRRSVKP